MGPDDPVWITEQDVVELVDLHDAIEAVDAHLAQQAEGTARTMEKTHASWNGGSTLHALGGIASAAGLVGSKTWAHTAGGATPLLMLWDSDRGQLRAVVEAFALGQLRTAAVSGVATNCLAAPAAATLAVVGSGKQALPQVAAMAAVRRLERVRIFSPTVEHRIRLAERLVDEGFDLAVDIASSVGEAVDGADVVTTVTRAREPFLEAGMLAQGAHVNAVGAITPERRELSGTVVAVADLVVADSPAAALTLSTELASLNEASVVSLGQVVAGSVARPPDPSWTVFKGMGLGLADVAVGGAVLERAVAAGRGRRIPHPERRTPRLVRPGVGIDAVDIQAASSQGGQR